MIEKHVGLLTVKDTHGTNFRNHSTNLRNPRLPFLKKLQRERFMKMKLFLIEDKTLLNDQLFTVTVRL